MAKRKYPDINKYAGLKWSKCDPEVYEHDDIETCTFCGKGIKDNERYYSLFEIEHASVDPALAACTKCALGAGMEW